MIPFLEEAEFVAHLGTGGLGVIPTDTVPGLVAYPEYAEAIYALKGRDLDKPLVLLGADTGALKTFTQGWLPGWTALTNRAWPGALTLVLPASGRVPTTISRGRETVGLRVPKHPAANALLKITGPLASTSVNRSGQVPLLDPEAIHTQFTEIPILMGEYYASGTASTVALWKDGDWNVLRQGNFYL